MWRKRCFFSTTWSAAARKPNTTYAHPAEFTDQRCQVTGTWRVREMFHEVVGDSAQRLSGVKPGKVGGVGQG